MPRFRIRTLFIFTAIVAVGMFLWMRYAPKIVGMTVRDSKFVVYLRPATRRLADPYDYESFRTSWIPDFTPPSESDIFFHDAYGLVEIPLLAIGVVLGIFAILIFGYLSSPYWLRRKRISRKSPPPEVQFSRYTK